MPYQVRIHASEQQFEVGDEELLLDAALRNDVRVSYSCRGGSCGACEALIINGQVGYAGEVLPPALSEDQASKGVTLLCQARAKSDLCIAVKEPRKSENTSRLLPARIGKLERAADDVMIVTLQLPPNQTLEFAAGQYLDILLRDGKRRSFSLANPPSRNNEIELHIRHVPGGLFTDPLFTTTKEKTVLRLEAPHGAFSFDSDSPRPAIFIAGGTGFAPIQSIVEQLLEDDPAQAIKVYWGVRSQVDLYATATLKRWQQHSNIELLPVLSEPKDGWSGASGWVTDKVAKDYPDIKQYDIYMAGPPPMITAGRNRFIKMGAETSQLHCDSFTYAADN